LRQSHQLKHNPWHANKNDNAPKEGDLSDFLIDINFPRLLLHICTQKGEWPDRQ